MAGRAEAEATEAAAAAEEEEAAEAAAGGERAPAAEQPAQPAPGVPAVGYMKGPAYGIPCVEHDAMNGWFRSFCGSIRESPDPPLSRTATRASSFYDQTRRLLFFC